MRCYRRVLGISYTEHITNEQVCTTITKHIKHYEELLKTVKKRKLQWNGYVTRAYRKPSSKVQLKVEEEEGAGRERNRWTTLLSGQGRALPQPKPLLRSIRGGDSWCGIPQCSTPTTPARDKGFVIMILYTYKLSTKEQKYTCFLFL